MTATVVPAICRICTAHCPILVTTENGHAVKVTGDPDAPLYDGYTCPKGRALPEQHNHPVRLQRSVKRDAQGQHRPIKSEQAIAEIAGHLKAIAARHGPRSVAVYCGMGSVPQPLAASVANAWTRAFGTPMFFTANTIDKPGVQIATALHGGWRGGQRSFDTARAWIIVGANPIISKAPGLPQNNPGQRIKEAVARGLQLIVIDPRRTETARRAQLHIQPRPGHDAAILAALVHVILDEGLHDRAFLADHAEGFDALAAAVAPFTPETVAARAGVPAQQLIDAARLFAQARGGSAHAGVTCGTGPSFSLHGSLCEYLALCLVTLCGHWARAGDPVMRPNVLLPAFEARAQPYAPYRAFGRGTPLRVRGLGQMAAGMPTSALADEILLEGEGQVKALLCIGGNPMMAWPDQTRAHAALQSLELLVTMDAEMTATAQLSHYVVAPKLSLETPGTTHSIEFLKYMGPSRGFEQPYAQYAPAVVEPPAGADVIEEWELFYRLAQHLELPLQWVNYYGWGRHVESPSEVLPIDMVHKPSSDDLWALACHRARVPLDEVKRHPHGHVFDDVSLTVQAGDPEAGERLQVGDATMMRELGEVLREVDPWPIADDNAASYPLRLVPRRLNNFLNSWGRTNPRLAGQSRHNPACLHPDDLVRYGLTEGDVVEVRSAYHAIRAIVAADDSLRPGVLSMAHGFGGNPGPDDDAADPREGGSNTGRLVSADAEYDPITGLPRMGALPVRVQRLRELK